MECVRSSLRDRTQGVKDSGIRGVCLIPRFLDSLIPLPGRIAGPKPESVITMLLCFAAMLSADVRVVFQATERKPSGVRSYEFNADLTATRSRFDDPSMVTVWNLEDERVRQWQPGGSFYYEDDIPTFVLQDCFQRYEIESNSVSARSLESRPFEELASRGNWEAIGTIFSELELGDRNRTSERSKALQQSLGLHLELVHDGEVVCGMTTDLLKAYSIKDMLLASFRVHRQGGQVLSDEQLKSLVSRIRRTSDTASVEELEAWRAYFRDGYVWLGQQVPSRSLNLRALRVEQTADVRPELFEVPADKVPYDGKGLVSLTGWKPWQVDGAEDESATAGQDISVRFTLACAGGNRAVKVLVKPVLRTSGQEIESARIETTVEMQDGEIDEIPFATTLSESVDDTLDLKVSLDGQPVGQNSIGVYAKP